MRRALCLLSVVRMDASDWSVSKSVITKCLAIRCFVILAINVKFISISFRYCSQWNNAVIEDERTCR